MPPGMTKQSVGVEHLVALEARADRLDRLALDQHVGDIAAVGGDDRSAFDRVDMASISSVIQPCPDTRRCRAATVHPTISAFSSTACISTLAPAVDHSMLDVLALVVADAVDAGREDHRRRRDAREIASVVPGAGDDVAMRIAEMLGRAAHRGDAFLRRRRPADNRRPA